MVSKAGANAAAPQSARAAASVPSTKPRPKPSRHFKGRPVYSPEQTAQMECPFPDESEWVAELKRKAAKRKR